MEKSKRLKNVLDTRLPSRQFVEQRLGFPQIREAPDERNLWPALLRLRLVVLV